MADKKKKSPPTTTTATTVVPRDASPELLQVITGAIAAVGQSQPQKDDPPVFSSGYWDYDESTGKNYWVNYMTTKPLSRAKQEFYELDKDELLRFQELAFQAGHYGASAERGDIPFGTKDDDTFKIWERLNERSALFFRSNKNLTLWDILQDDVNNRPANLGKKKGKQPLVTVLPDPRDLEELVRSVAPGVIGRDPDEAFTQDFIAMYQRIQSTFQEAKHALAETEEGGTITAPPDPQALAAFRLRTENPEQYEEKRAAARQAAYTALLKGAL